MGRGRRREGGGTVVQADVGERRGRAGVWAVGDKRRRGRGRDRGGGGGRRGTPAAGVGDDECAAYKAHHVCAHATKTGYDCKSQHPGGMGGVAGVILRKHTERKRRSEGGTGSATEEMRARAPRDGGGGVAGEIWMAQQQRRRIGRGGWAAGRWRQAGVRHRGRRTPRTPGRDVGARAK